MGKERKWKGSKFHHVVCFPATLLPGEIPLRKGKRLCKTRIVDFPLRNSNFSGGKFYFITIFYGGKFYYENIIVIFPGGKLSGG